MPQTINNLVKNIEVTPTVSNGVAYTAQDQVGGIQTLTAACLGKKRSAAVSSVVVVDKSSQSAALTIFFFDELPTVASVDNGGISITDAEMADKCIGWLAVPAANYTAVTGNTTASVNAAASGLYLVSNETSGNIYAVVKTTGTPTYTSTTDLVFKYVLVQD